LFPSTDPPPNYAIFINRVRALRYSSCLIEQNPAGARRTEKANGR
jgi:hypothetical protein